MKIQIYRHALKDHLQFQLIKYDGEVNIVIVTERNLFYFYLKLVQHSLRLDL